MLDPNAEQAIAGAVAAVRQLFGPRLASMAVYGSGAGPDFVAGVSDINLLVALDTVAAADLVALRPHLKRWRKQRIATPLVVDRAFLATAADVFAIEFLSIKTHHTLLCGADLFAALVVGGDNLRHQCEYEARGKQLRLRERYLEIGDDRRQLRTLMLESVKTFLLIMRSVSRLRGAAPTPSMEAELRAFAEQSGQTFPTMMRLLQIRRGERWTGDDHETFRLYLDEVQHVVDGVDAIAAAPLPDVLA